MTIEVNGQITPGFTWLDVYAPESEELQEVAERYKIHPVLIKDCLQPDHLPKHEVMENYSFIIFRVHSESNPKNVDTVQELTHKVAIFYSETFVITIHRHKQPLVDRIIAMGENKPYKSVMMLVNSLVAECLDTYQPALSKLSAEIDYYESVIFLRPKNIPLLKGLYHMKRKVDLIKRMVELSQEIIDALDSKSGNVYTRDTKDLFIRLKNLSSYLSENSHNLLNIYFSTTSQRTNETMRILTIFSVFFMPLTFIVGIYGMNFDYMPELKWIFGYPAVMVAMIVVTVVIYLWFKRKNWL
ncbi:CorA family divalent cation transporter [Sphingobacterium sp. CZ-UAM]|uniref:magnesium transporter CorA family protein n=1 Tax=Sphingobacterium sp. CZ-UAM TaxID=1933868 RepID=UPI0009879153|nr:CorA family divalent cation transporter [Sphingobacterium sp. CZ-UAM]